MGTDMDKQMSKMQENMKNNAAANGKTPGDNRPAGTQKLMQEQYASHAGNMKAMRDMGGADDDGQRPVRRPWAIGRQEDGRARARMTAAPGHDGKSAWT